MARPLNMVTNKSLKRLICKISKLICVILVKACLANVDNLLFDRSTVKTVAICVRMTLSAK